jgi:hypothetical protein
VNRRKRIPEQQKAIHNKHKNKMCRIKVCAGGALLTGWLASESQRAGRSLIINARASGPMSVAKTTI